MRDVAKRLTPWNPNTGDWLVAQRGNRNQDDVVADLAARGVVITRGWLSRIENGTPFSSDLFDAFTDYYGSVPPPYDPAPRGDTLSGAESLAVAILALTAELEAARGERAAWAGRLEQTDAALDALAERTSAIEARLDARPHSMGSGR